jgi:two-component system, NarL family, sensor histidine kinase DegS
MKTAATDGDATERAIAAAEPPFNDRAGTSSVVTTNRMVGSQEVAGGGGMPTPAPNTGRAGDPSTMQGALSAELVELERELDEIGMLVGQAKEEAERHENRRAKADERVNALETDPRATPDELRDARRQLLAQTRRHMLFEAQDEVLEGKLRALTRYRDSLIRIIEALGGASVAAPRALASGAGVDPMSPRRGAPAAVSADSMVVLRAKEELRKEIARQIHDGPAQSLANIALQSEIVERLVGRGDPRAKQELILMRGMVQSTLAATKAFIFDVRPMVLDDLGLVPTFRRSTGDRAQRSGIVVDFDSSGTDRRLPADLETGLFRIVDEALAASLAGHPDRVSVHLDWNETEVTATVRNHWPTKATITSSTPAAELPPALAEMIHEANTAERRATVDAQSLPASLLSELAERAAALGALFTVLDDGTTVEVVAPVAG